MLASLAFYTKREKWKGCDNQVFGARKYWVLDQLIPTGNSLCKNLKSCHVFIHVS
jgi:hypothetical protein